MQAGTEVMSWSEVSKLDLMRAPTRAVWQLTERVVASLGVEPGDQVADVGAGDGHFTFRLADAVGPTGRIYAVEVEEEKVAELEELVRERGYSNIEVVLGEYEDPLLPDQTIDLVFLCNTYHHMEDRKPISNASPPIADRRVREVRGWRWCSPKLLISRDLQVALAGRLVPIRMASGRVGAGGTGSL